LEEGNRILQLMGWAGALISILVIIYRL